VTSPGTKIKEPRKSNQKKKTNETHLTHILISSAAASFGNLIFETAIFTKEESFLQGFNSSDGSVDDGTHAGGTHDVCRQLTTSPE
jgi:hypothetical protein